MFGVADETLPVVKGAFEAVVALAGHKMAETDPELGSNCMMFFLRDWDELLAVPDLDRLLPDLAGAGGSAEGGRRQPVPPGPLRRGGGDPAAFVFLRMDGPLASMPADTLALSQVVQIVLLWSETAFRDRSPLALAGETAILRPEIAGLIRAAYDPVLPAAAQDPAHALRLFARLERAT